MSSIEVIHFVWLLALSAAMILNAAAVFSLRKRYDSYDQRELDLHHAERMQRIIDIVTIQRMAQNKELRRSVSVLLDDLQADPVSQEKYWLECKSLRDKLAE